MRADILELDDRVVGRPIGDGPLGAGREGRWLGRGGAVSRDGGAHEQRGGDERGDHADYNCGSSPSVAPGSEQILVDSARHDRMKRRRIHVPEPSRQPASSRAHAMTSIVPTIPRAKCPEM